MEYKSKIQIIQNFGKAERFSNAEQFSSENCSSLKKNQNKGLNFEFGIFFEFWVLDFDLFIIQHLKNVRKIGEDAITINNLDVSSVI